MQGGQGALLVPPTPAQPARGAAGQGAGWGTGAAVATNGASVAVLVMAQGMPTAVLMLVGGTAWFVRPPLAGHPLCGARQGPWARGNGGNLCQHPSRALLSHPGALCSTASAHERGSGAEGTGLFAHGCLLAICKCKTGPEGAELPGLGGHGACPHAECCLPRPPVPPALSPLRPRPFPPVPGASWALSKRGLFAQAGISRSLCSFDFLLP